jgi:Na+-driven multidrug efflux pump
MEGIVFAFLGVTDHERTTSLLTLIKAPFSLLPIIIPWALGRADLPMVGYCQIIVQSASLFLSISICLWKGWFKKYSKGMLTVPFTDKEVLKSILKTSAPLGFAYLLTYGEWEVLTIFASFLGPAEVAAWGFLGFVWGLLEQFSDGVADAAEVRVGFHLGANNPEQARLAAYKAIFLGALSSLFATSILFLIGEDLVRWLTPDPTLQRLMVELLPLVGIGQVAMTTGIVSWAIIGAQGRYRLSTGMQFIGSWGVTIPLSAFFTYGLKINLQGLAAALCIGYTMAGTGNTYILIRSQWARLATIISAENAEDSSEDSSLDASSHSCASSITDQHAKKGGSSQPKVVTMPASLLSPNVPEPMSDDDDSVDSVHVQT